MGGESPTGTALPFTQMETMSLHLMTTLTETPILMQLMMTWSISGTMHTMPGTTGQMQTSLAVTRPLTPSTMGIHRQLKISTTHTMATTITRLANLITMPTTTHTTQKVKPDLASKREQLKLSQVC